MPEYLVYRTAWIYVRLTCELFDGKDALIACNYGPLDDR